MLHSLKDLEGYTIGATDGEVGHVKDFYFDDHAWAVRYLVVETGDWLKSRKVLISPHAIQHLEVDGQNPACCDYAGAGQEQPGYRYGQAHFTSARDSVPQLLRLSVLLG